MKSHDVKSSERQYMRVYFTKRVTDMFPLVLFSHVSIIYKILYTYTTNLRVRHSQKKKTKKKRQSRKTASPIIHFSSYAEWPIVAYFGLYLFLVVVTFLLNKRRKFIFKLKKQKRKRRRRKFIVVCKLYRKLVYT